ncbi:mechanosensitive ion channel family protein [Plebeiibacterium marinum]|uniref:Mechanosensitive ion channel n=1 Tax=Plebeiibacterium marinum TaxID=2992111 RepID=A0AAE3MD88_9BACT|nr:mechanosensitive ion channel domain-containing protein [Plebeiobacterium marinum]MCW3805648.1 mechanosensitive ion channel [Plebeiobacterium marinum]
MEQIMDLFESSKGYIVAYGGQLVLAIITLIVGFWVIAKITKGMKKAFQIKQVDVTLQPFLVGLLSYILKILLVISVMSMVGIQMTSFIAILGAAGLAVGMALSGTLQNFAGGVMLLVLKPFKKGDFIEAQGYKGTVQEIQIFSTILNTPDNRVIFIPNGGLSTSSLINYSRESNRRVDFSFGIGYGDDIDKAKGIILDVISQNDKIFETPEPFVAVGELADSSVNITTRVWCKGEDYWGVFFYMNEAVKKAFDKQGVSIPFPQTDVHLFKAE